MNALVTNKKYANLKGFTIIEVVLVLAIAGLIFLMVFIALPALQRSQRDTQRKNDAGRLLSQVNSYQSNTRGKVPAAANASQTSFIDKYLKADGDTFDDPSGDEYAMQWAHGAITTTTPGEMYYNTGAVCDPSDAAKTTSAAARKVAVRVPLEGGGVYCTNN